MYSINGRDVRDYVAHGFDAHDDGHVGDDDIALADLLKLKKCHVSNLK